MPISNSEYQVVLETSQAGAIGSTDMAGWSRLTVNVTGNFVGTLTWQASLDPEWSRRWPLGLQRVTDGTLALSTTAPGQFYLPMGVSSISALHFTVQPLTSGSVRVAVRKEYV